MAATAPNIPSSQMISKRKKGASSPYRSDLSGRKITPRSLQHILHHVLFARSGPVHTFKPIIPKRWQDYHEYFPGLRRGHFLSILPTYFDTWWWIFFFYQEEEEMAFGGKMVCVCYNGQSESTMLSVVQWPVQAWAHLKPIRGNSEHFAVVIRKRHLLVPESILGKSCGSHLVSWETWKQANVRKKMKWNQEW